MSHIMVWRGGVQEDGLNGFWHHGIQCADGSVIHYSGMYGVKSLRDARVMRTGMDKFKVDEVHEVHEVRYGREAQFSAEEVERRAESLIGHGTYHLLFDNCESFARWCVTGKKVSHQAQGAFFAVGAAALSVVSGGGFLGAVLTALVAHKYWDRRANQSDLRIAMNPHADDARAHGVDARAQKKDAESHLKNT